MKKKFLVFQHVPHEPLGLIADSLKKLKVDFEVVQFWKKYTIPNVLDYDGLIIMGGPMGVYDGKDVFPSKEDEVLVIKTALGKIPIIGFCLGAQLLSYAFGGKIYPNIKASKRVKEIGYYTVDLTKKGQEDPLLEGFLNPLPVFQFHGDAFDIPKGAIKLASSALCDNQALKVGKNAYGFLFHVEVTPKIIEKLLQVENNWIHQDFEMDEVKLRQQAIEMEGLMQKQCQKMFENFVKLS